MRVSCVLVGLLLTVAAVPASGQAADPDSARIVTSDVPRFWWAWDRMQEAATREDSLRALFEEYYLGASPGLEDFIRSRISSVYDLLAAIREQPRYYASIRPSTLRVAEFEPAIRRAFHSIRCIPTPSFPTRTSCSGA